MTWRADLIKLVVTVAIAVTPWIITMGQIKSDLSENKRKLDLHIEAVTPLQERERSELRLMITKEQSESAHLKELIAELKQQNIEILRLLRKQR